MILHTEIHGSGEAIVFLHTGLQTSATDFIPQQTAFLEDYQVISPDLRGHGKSAATDISNFFEDSANDLNETLENLGLYSVHIVGASLGALVAIYFAKRFPDRLKSLTISGVTKQKPENWREMHRADVTAQTELLNNEEVVGYFKNLHGAGWDRFITMGRNEQWYPFHETSDLTGIAAPVLVMAGEGNSTESISAIDYGREQENVHVAILPFGSHLIHAEQPELYSKTLELFLKNIPPQQM